MALRCVKECVYLRPARIYAVMSWRSMSKPSDDSDLGKGVGKGGGAGGAIREAGGAFGKREAAQEEEYFYRLQKEQISKLKDHLEDEIDHHELQLKHHQEAIDRHKKRLSDIKKKEK